MDDTQRFFILLLASFKNICIFVFGIAPALPKLLNLKGGFLWGFLFCYILTIPYIRNVKRS